MYIDYWIPVIDKKVPTLKALLKVEIPVDYKIFFKNQFIDTFKSDTTDLFINYSWSASYSDVIEPEYFSPPFASFLPHVIILPQKFNFAQAGSFETWSTFGDWQNEVLSGLSSLPQTEKTTINRLIEGINDTKEKVKILYNYLQDNTRYINITIETGGYIPYPASYVAENKYGDCKALTNYFKSVLDYAGIQSFYTEVFAGDKKTQIDKSFPSPQFNHIILCVPVHNDTIWLDCTSDEPFGYLGTFTQDRDVFLIDKKGSRLVKTPALLSDDVLEARKVEISKNIQNQTMAIISGCYRGGKYESLFLFSHFVNESVKLQTFRNHFVEDGFELIDFKLTEPGRDIPEIYLTYTAKTNKIYKYYGNDLLIDILTFPIPRFEDPGKRKLPVQIDYPVFKIDTLEYEIPLGYAVSDNLKNHEIVSEFGKYKIESVKKDRKVEIIKSFLIYPGMYSVSSYPGFYEFIRKVIDIEKANMIVANKKF